MTKPILSPIHIDPLSRAWDEHPEVLKHYTIVQPQYEQLASEVAYILKKLLNKSAIEYASVTYRTKTFSSLAEKIHRKTYKNPLTDITDFAGVRLVYLYKNDRPKIEQIIETDFVIIEKADKAKEQEEDRFGYNALHYVVKLGKTYSGARYDDLKTLSCEIQVRTILQDAWAIVNHHLSYKQESDVPPPLKRKLSSLSALFETADDQFGTVRSEQEQYRKEMKNTLKNNPGELDREIDLDLLTEFLSNRFPKKKVSGSDAYLSLVLSHAREKGVKTLADVDNVLNRTRKARIEAGRERPTTYAIGEFGRAMAFLDSGYLKYFNDKSQELIRKYKHLVEKK